MEHKVVIIEDNIPLGEAFEDIINSSNSFKVTNRYTNCEEALRYLKEDHPNIILMDIELPGINGVEGTAKIKALLPLVNVIMVTVYENSEIVFDALCAGSTGYLTKNLKPEELVGALD